MYRILLLCIYFIRSVLCWEVVMDHGEIVYQDPKYANAYLNVTRYNQTNYVILLTGDLYKDIPCSAKVDLRLLGEFSNVYKELPAKVIRTLKNVYQFEYKFVAVEMRKYTNLPEDCPIQPKNYYVKDFSPNLSVFKEKAPVIPWNTNKYLFAIKILVKNKKVLQFHYFARITRDDEYKVQ